MPTQDIEQARLIGEMHGLVKAMRETQLAQGGELKALDTRLREQETTAARHGAVYGGAVALGIALLVEGGKQWMRDRIGGGGS